MWPHYLTRLTLSHIMKCKIRRANLTVCKVFIISLWNIWKRVKGKSLPRLFIKRKHKYNINTLHKYLHIKYSHTSTFKCESLPHYMTRFVYICKSLLIIWDISHVLRTLLTPISHLLIGPSDFNTRGPLYTCLVVKVSYLRKIFWD